jgi:dihydroneopterin aldolase
MDRIALNRIVAFGRHGADPGERDRAQPFHIDVVLDLDLSRPSRTDELDDTVNYAALHRAIVEIIESRSYALLERLAGAVAEEVMSDTRIARASITIAKPQLLDGATPSVTIRRERN